MDLITTLQELKTHSLDEQLDFLFLAWDQLSEQGWQPQPTGTLREELTRRIAAYEANPQDVLTWEQIVEKLGRPR